MEKRFNLVAYTEELAARLKAVAHSSSCKRFFTVGNLGDLDGFLDSQYGTAPPYVITVDAEQESNKTEDVSSRFSTIIVMAAAKEEARGITRSIKSRLLRDRESYEHGLEGLVIDSISDVEFGPYLNLKCRMLSFYIDDANDLDYKEEEWN